MPRGLPLKKRASRPFVDATRSRRTQAWQIALSKESCVALGSRTRRSNVRWSKDATGRIGGPCRNSWNWRETSNKIIQKGLALVADWSGSEGRSGLPFAFRDRAPPAVSPRWGFGGAARAVINRMEIPMPKPAKKFKSPVRSSSKSPNAVMTKPLQEPAQPTAPRSGGVLKKVATSKQAQVIAMLQSTSGATIAAMMKATGWQQHSVRGFLAGVVRKKLKLQLTSMKVDSDRVYRIDHGTEAEATGKQSRRRAA
jgi:hypothetical protein